MHPFAAALEASNADAAIALLADDVVFRSPVVFRPYYGRDAAASILRAVVRVFDDFRYVREMPRRTAAPRRSSSGRGSAIARSTAATSCTSTSVALSTSSS
jgi:hypothetical protein